MIPDLSTIVAFLILIVFLVFVIAVVGYVVFIIFRYRGREERSVDSVYLQVSVPRLNEIKTDAMEQLFASLYSIKKGGWKQKFAVQPAISFEIVARSEDIKFFIWTPSEYKDLIEKIAPTFSAMSALYKVDQSRLPVEYYKRDNEFILYLPILK